MKKGSILTFAALICSIATNVQAVIVNNQSKQNLVITNIELSRAALSYNLEITTITQRSSFALKDKHIIEASTKKTFLAGGTAATSDFTASYEPPIKETNYIGVIGSVLRITFKTPQPDLKTFSFVLKNPDKDFIFKFTRNDYELVIRKPSTKTDQQKYYMDKEAPLTQLNVKIKNVKTGKNVPIESYCLKLLPC